MSNTIWPSRTKHCQDVFIISLRVNPQTLTLISLVFQSIITAAAISSQRRAALVQVFTQKLIAQSTRDVQRKHEQDAQTGSELCRHRERKPRFSLGKRLKLSMMGGIDSITQLRKIRFLGIWIFRFWT